MSYQADYTILINGATWGREELSIEVETDEEAIKIALDYEAKYIERRGDDIKELLLDQITDENGNEINYERN